MKACILLTALAATIGACTGIGEEQEVSASRDTTYRIDSVIVPEPRRPRGAEDSGGLTRLLPVDEAVEAPDFFAYRMRLIEAVGARDTSALFSLMSNDIRISFGRDDGLSGFREMWRPSQPNSEVWMHLGRVLGGGGILEEESLPSGEGRTASARFTAPYYFATFPGEQYDPFQHGVILGADVPVLERAEAGAPALDTLSFAVVRVPSFIPHETASGDWVRLELDGGRFGFVRAGQIASPVGYRALFHRIDGVWTMTAFVAGD